MHSSQFPAPLRWLLYEPGGATRRDWTVDAALTGCALLLLVTPHAIAVATMGSILITDRYGHPVATFIAALCFILPLVLRRHYPLLMVSIMAIAGLLTVAVAALPIAPVAVVPAAAYSVARWVPGRASRLVVWLGLLGSLLGPARWLFTWNSITPEMVFPYMLMVLVCFFAVITPYAIGRRVQETEEFQAREAHRLEALHRAQMEQAEQRARMAEIAARQRIAQELHDIVAHSLSVMIVQAEGGRALATKRPTAALEALDTVAETGREALGEMRRLVSVLRTDNIAQFGPAPTMADLPELVRRAGDRIRLEVNGEPYPVPSAVGLTVYRVVQEAVTNVFKHAGPHARAVVTLTYGERDMIATVVDDGDGANAPDDGRGNGLRGMAERVASVGGTLLARPREEGGFMVRIRIPRKREQR